MPRYEFFCGNCKRLFSTILSLVDYEKGGILCPHCGSKEVSPRSASSRTLKDGVP